MLRERLDEELKAAMKARDKLRLEALRMLLAAVKNIEIDKHHKLSDEEFIDAVIRECKIRQESAIEFGKSGRRDLEEVELKKAEIIKSYLPEQLTTAELEEIVKKVIADTGARGPQDIGRVMSAVMPQAKGCAEGKLINETVRRLLGE